MAVIRDELQLIDKFTNVWNNFINLGSEATTTAAAAAESVTKIEEASTRSVDQVDRFSIAVDENTRAIYSWTEQVGNYDRAALAFINTADELVEQGFLVKEAVVESTKAVDQFADALDAAEEPAKKFNQSNEDVNRSANKAANDGISNLTSKLTKLAAVYFSARAWQKSFSDALAESTYQIKFEAAFDDSEVAASAMTWARQMANEYGLAVNDMLAATNKFLRVTSNPQNLDGLTKLSAKLSEFSEGRDFTALSNAIQRSLLTGNTTLLAAQSGISKGLLEEYGVDKAAKAGDVSKFVDALERAAAAAGMTDEAYEKLLNGSEKKFQRFQNNIKNTMQAVSRSFLDGFSPVFDKLNDWFTSTQAQEFFAQFALFAQVAGQAVSVLVDAVVWFLDLIANNFTEILTVGIVLLGIFAAKMIASAAATLLAHWPILLIVGAVIALLMLLDELGITSEEIFGFIAGLAGGLFATVWNIIVDLWNFIAAFGEFIGSFLIDPIGSIVRLFVSLADTVLGILQTLAKAIDWVFGSNLAGTVQGWRDGINGWVNDTFGESPVKIDRLEYKDLNDTIEQWSGAGRDFGKALDDFNMDEWNSTMGLNGAGTDAFYGFDGNDSLINVGNVGTVGKVNSNQEVNLADEDLRMLVDLAERRQNIQINTVQSTPNIEVNVQNGSNLDGNDIARRIGIILENQAAMHSDGVYSY